ncbi:MAG: J domain-containing protein [Fusobacteriota bacterium]
MIYLGILLLLLFTLGGATTMYILGTFFVVYLLFTSFGYILFNFPVIVIILIIYWMTKKKKPRNKKQNFKWRFYGNFDDFDEFFKQNRRSNWKSDYGYRQQNNSFNNSSTSIDEYYSILGASPSDSMDTIKRKYKKLAKKYHPDLHGTKGQKQQSENEKKFKKINEAYNEIKKRKM